MECELRFTPHVYGGDWGLRDWGIEELRNCGLRDWGFRDLMISNFGSPRARDDKR